MWTLRKRIQTMEVLSLWAVEEILLGMQYTDGETEYMNGWTESR